MERFKILGVSASLRNARKSTGNENLVNDLNNISTKEELVSYLDIQAKYHLENFQNAGREDQKPFDELYKNLKKLKGDKGLSNSEVALASSLWSAKELGAEIDHVSLAEYFKETRTAENIEELKYKMKEADGIILSTPVYFGDRGSLSQSFIELIRNDSELKEALEDKVYAGVAVGAKRNGGQETTLIYQLIDMINSGLLGVGNDSETTSQYGGTGHAGDIGTMSTDDYGLKTAMGTGRRIARVSNMIAQGKKKRLKGKHKVNFWVLQDKNGLAVEKIKNLIQPFHDSLEANIIDFSDENIMRCLACDICPTHIDVDEAYRCIIKNKKDGLKSHHNEMIDCDAIIPVAYSPVDRNGLKSNYQRFIERTRYLRRGDYVFSDLLTAPLVFEELGAHENLDIRMMTSMMRHHTVLSNPMIGYLNDGEILNGRDLNEDFQKFNARVRELITGQILTYSSGVNHLKYQPVGYVLSAHKDEEDEKLNKRQAMVEKRIEKAREMKENRLEEIKNPSHG